MEIVLIRHGEPREGDRDSPNDPPLTLQGRTEAFGSARLLAREGVNRIVASPLRRAQETAEPFAALTGLPIETREDWSEIDRHHDGPYRSMETLRIAGGEAWATFVRDPFALFGLDAVAFRKKVIDALLSEFEEGPAASRIVIATHGMPIRICVSHVLNASEFLRLATGYGSVTRIQRLDDGSLRIKSFSEISHLR